MPKHRQTEFLPTSSSWLNSVKRFFRELTAKVVKDIHKFVEKIYEELGIGPS